MDFDFSPYVGTYTPDQGMIESYGLGGLVTNLTLYSDGALMGRVIHEGEPPARLLSGSESKGGSGSYTLMLYEGKMEMEGYEIPQEEYYILYPQGVSDRWGGDSATTRILYADLTGGAMEMLFTKVD